MPRRARARCALLVVVVLAVGLGLAGCAGPGGGAPTSQDWADRDRRQCEQQGKRWLPSAGICDSTR